MSMKVIQRLAAGLLGTVVLVSEADAQQQGGGQTGGTTGGSTGGQTTGTSTSTQNTGQNSTQTSGTTGGMSSSTGSTNPSGSGSPLGAASGPSQFSLSGGSGSRSSGSGNRGTIGSRTNTATRSATKIGQAGGAGRSSFGNTGTQRQQAQQRAQYVTRVDFGAAMPGGTQVAVVEMKSSIEASVSAVAGSGASVKVDGETVVLRGTVASEADRRIAERMVMLEPGVRQVRNELTVQRDASNGR